MIAETSAFLTWALQTRAELPRIPRRRVDEGGFTQLLAMPGARRRIGHWWDCTLERIERSMG
jgi:hypothetical protein